MIQPWPVRGLIAAAALLAVAACSSPAGLSSTSGPAASLSAADRSFIPQAAYGSLSEVALGQLAAEQAGSPAVRDFGRMMVAEHTRMNEDLIAVASRKGVTPPTAPDPGRQEVAETLAQLSGPTFDEQYVPQQIVEHEIGLTLLQGELRSGQDAELRAFAERYTPVVERHLAMLRQLSAQTVSAR